ncbi:hypothetical protein BP5796_05284 [Coleophoma crateriformis]|uniref:Rad4-domain-containing protein n=1 Tax=Coleophoma crateriformis TaxID=565419 RepID=A0A3D8S2V0_9HELO|nr:hypothetical protein BP5796_05284 [Coleophoma crateriformis]
MPPFLPRKDLRSSSPEAEQKHSGANQGSRTRGKGVSKSASVTSRKPTLFEDLDAGTSSKGSKSSAERNKAVLEKLAAVSDDSESSLSSLSDLEFEDIPHPKRQKISVESDDEDEDVEFEDVQTYAPPAPAPLPSGDLELTLTKDTRISLTNPLGTKKGPSKIERQIRIYTHQIHVQTLLWHNAVRNSWLCDGDIHQILLKHLHSNPGAEKEIRKWRERSGLSDKEELERSKSKGKGKGKAAKANINPRSARDWGQPAQKLAVSEVDLSRGDPLYRFLEWLSKWWKQMFRITAPGLRKRGYMSLERLDEEMKSFNKDKHDPEIHGERVTNIQEFRTCAENLEGSRDLGAQLFTALLRAIGLEARMVANLQPVGFGWNKNEDATPKKQKKLYDPGTYEASANLGDESGLEEAEGDVEAVVNTKISRPRKGKASGKGKAADKNTELTRRSRGSGLKHAPIDLSESEAANTESEDDDASVIDVTPARRRPALPSKPFDKDLLYPYYWSEVLSPLTNTFIPVDAMALKIVATTSDLLEKFEPRGAKAEKAKQITSYIVGHSADGTAKDVTTRYLKRHTWPGRTKGNRIPIEKVPVYNHKGKVKRHEEYDWFKTVMSGYVRGSRKTPLTEIDDHEDATDLKIIKPEKKEIKEGEETLQTYKASPDFVLERHLKREEALLPSAKHVKMFMVKGKGDSVTEEKVFLRKDVVKCKSMETWHKEGRAPLEGEEPLKRVPYRAATTNRKRELAEAEHATGQKMLQGLYSFDQTDWIIPPPIENGVIPKNNYGNMDVYVESMVPVGAVHIPRRGTAKICKKLGIDFAEAVTGFEFGARMAIPIITGVVIAEENYELVIEQWRIDEQERLRKEDEKRTKAAIGMWRKMLMGMRIIERVREEYGEEVGHQVDALNPWTNKNKSNAYDLSEEQDAQRMGQQDEDMAGGFFPEGHDEEEVPNHSSFFPVVHEDEDNEQGGGFFVEGHDDLQLAGQAYPTPQSFENGGRPEVRLDTAGQEEDRPSGLEDVTPAKERGQLATSSTAKSKTPAKRGKTVMPIGARQRKRKVVDSGDEDDESSEVETPKKAPGAKRRRATLPPKATEGTRKTPRRNAARKSETALRSHYFENSEDIEDDE